MFKKFVITLFLLFSSYTVLATTVGFNDTDFHTKEKALSLNLNQVVAKSAPAPVKAITTNEEVVSLDDQRAEKNMNKSQPNSNDQTGWLLVFALLGFVMLSNRRGI